MLINLMIFPPLSAMAGKQDKNTKVNPEYEIKATFLLNFAKFVEWPADIADSNSPVRIGIVGDDPFGDLLALVQKKQKQNVTIEHFKSYKALEQTGNDEAEPDAAIEPVKRCHLIFICSSEKDKLSDIISLVQNNSILTVGESEGLLEAGGIIQFLTIDKKVRFNINLTAAKKSRLTISSQLLRLATTVIEEKPEKKKDK